MTPVLMLTRLWMRLWTKWVPSEALQSHNRLPTEGPVDFVVQLTTLSYYQLCAGRRWDVSSCSPMSGLGAESQVGIERMFW